MRRQWQVYHQVVPYPDGQHRWDRAYQSLLQKQPLVKYSRICAQQGGEFALCATSDSIVH
jgi:hypothetical protein